MSNEQMTQDTQTPQQPRWKWDGGDRFSIGGRMYVGAEVAELLDRYEQQDRMKTREINLIVPENKALEAKANHLEAALREAEAKVALADDVFAGYDEDALKLGDVSCDYCGAWMGKEPHRMLKGAYGDGTKLCPIARYDALQQPKAGEIR